MNNFMLLCEYCLQMTAGFSKQFIQSQMHADADGERNGPWGE